MKKARWIRVTRLTPWRLKGAALVGACLAALLLVGISWGVVTIVLGQLVLQQVVFDLTHRPSGPLQ